MNNYPLSLERFRELYDISDKGFLPTRCVDLPEQLTFIDDLANKLNLSGEKFRQKVREMISNHPYNEDEYKIDSFEKDVIKTLYSTMSFICHKYIWGCGHKNYKVSIPKEIGILWHQSAEMLGLPMVLTHASVDLYNWRNVNDIVDFEKITVENFHQEIESRYTFYHDKQEKMWEQGFYLPMVVIEGIGSQVLYDMYMIQHHIKKNNYNELILTLKKISLALENMTKVVNMVHILCDPEFFFDKLRIYLKGSEDVDFFPKGLTIEDYDHPPIKWNGGSAAQSSLIQCFDRVLTVEHQGHAKEFLENMLEYMPFRHRVFLNVLDGNLKIKSYIQTIHNLELDKLYKECIKKLIKFRTSHFRLVHKFVIKFTQKKQKNTNVHQDKGTGGTDPQSFLSQVIKNTRQSKTKFKLNKGLIYNYMMVMAMIVVVVIFL